jgi:nucleotide-binding universal stress UspA family protein
MIPSKALFVLVVVAAAEAAFDDNIEIKRRAMQGETSSARKVMVVAEPTRESAVALQYALSHAVLEQDELVLLHVENPNSWRNTFTTFLRRPGAGSSSTMGCSDGGGGGGDFVEEMKHACKAAQPKLRVHVERVEILEGKDKASVILFQSMLLRIDLIIIGQRRSLSTAILG